MAAAASLIKAHRTHGHLAAHLDPLGSEPVGDPALEPELLVPKLTPELQARIPASVLRVGIPGETLADVLPRLRETYCGTIAYEIEHISDHQERVWLRQAIESGRYRSPLTEDEKKRMLARLTEVEGFEHYLRRAFLGQKQFSIEGLDVMVPMLDESLSLAAEAGAHEVVIGMAHRGRLNVLAHIIGRPYEELLREFEGERTIEAVTATAEGASGDVKYHLGAVGRRPTSAGELTVSLAANPSHLEAVDPVVEGITRAEQTDRAARAAPHDPSVALPVLIHGDASFPGQGVVAETLNLQGLIGYTTGGTLHLIANNQVGFTTDPADGRSTRYSSDLAKGFDIPIIHVNADDPQAAIWAIRLALAFRRRFAHDVVVDLVGYRRHGHNEGDEAAFTQPLMAQQIAEQPSVRDQFVEALVAEGTITREEAERLAAEQQTRLRSAHETLKTTFGTPSADAGDRTPDAADARVVTAVPAERLRELNAELVSTPEGFTVNPKLVKQLQRRVEALDAGGIDWGQAEALALGALLVEGISVRFTGQDTERGTFSHRHLVLHDVVTGAQYAPIGHLSERSGVVRAAQLAALRVRGTRLRVRLFDRGAGSARALGSAVRRLRQRRADRDRPVPGLRPAEVEADLAADAPASTRLRGQRAGALEREAGEIPPAGGTGEHPHRQRDDRGPVLPPASASGARSERPPAGRDDPERAPAAEGSRVDPGRPDLGLVRAGARRPARRP